MSSNEIELTRRVNMETQTTGFPPYYNPESWMIRYNPPVYRMYGFPSNNVVPILRQMETRMIDPRMRRNDPLMIDLRNFRVTQEVQTERIAPPISARGDLAMEALLGGFGNIEVGEPINPFDVINARLQAQAERERQEGRRG